MNLSKTLVRRTLLVCGLAGAILVLLFIFNFDFENLPQNSLAALSVNNNNNVLDQENNNFGLPVRVKIPKINVNSVVQNVGFASDGAMGVPSGPAEIGWFEFGSRPGEIGNSVMAGHSGWKDNIPAVFDDLYKLKIGDEILTEDDRGEIITFSVREIRKYSPNADATKVFVSDDEKSHLVLITCTGIWNKIWKSHSQRLVVFADKIE